MIIRINRQLFERNIIDVDVTVVMLVGAKVWKTKTVKSSISPVWNEHFEVFISLHHTYITPD